MHNGFIKTAAGVPLVTVADVGANTEEIKRIIDKADEKGVNLLILPELCVTGYTCGDLFLSHTLQKSAEAALTELAEYSAGKYPAVAVGLPLVFDSKLFNCAVLIHGGKILGAVPKAYIPNYGEFYEKRYFVSGDTLPKNAEIRLGGDNVPFGAGLLFRHRIISEYSFSLEICEDLWSATQTAEKAALNGAVIIGNLSASNEVIGKAEYRRTLLSATSARLFSGYIYASAADGESSQDAVFSGHCLIYENGVMLAENPPFGESSLTVSEIDVQKLSGERLKNTSFSAAAPERIIEFNQPLRKTALTRVFPKLPFVPSNTLDVDERAEAILQIQSYGLKKRMLHTRSKAAVIGISGGLDSTLALLVAVRTMKLLNRPASDITAVTMPCFGTTSRTRSNSEELCRLLGVSFKEINITDAVRQHFKDIGQSEKKLDVTFENSQARERTQVLMDVANRIGGLVVGTGDLSELALGWATYNGDHMSMYGVNASVPKTLIRYIVRYEAESSEPKLKNVLLDILDTPVSPELLPGNEKGEIAQKTEDLVGPYELHDFFLYHMLRFGEGPEKIFRLAREAFKDDYSAETILHWLSVFINRFFSQQFKRSCLPDGPKVGSVTLSPRSDWRMPSDASAACWLKELEKLKI